MRKRSNPWPAFVDLFSALLIASFGGLMLLSAAYQHRVEHEVVVSDVRRAADELHSRLLLAVAKQEKLKSRVHPCGEDMCIDLYIHFPRGEDKVLNPGENAALHDLAADLRRGLDQLPDRRDVELIVEGHTDSSQPEIKEPRDLYLYNWDLSALRASSVVYEFRKEDLTVEKYKIAAIGKADSDQLPCTAESPAVCDDKNRRTTLRLHIDTLSIEERVHRLRNTPPTKR